MPLGPPPGLVTAITAFVGTPGCWAPSPNCTDAIAPAPAVSVAVRAPPPLTVVTRTGGRALQLTIVSVSVAELSARFGSVTPAGAVTEAVFASDPEMLVASEAVAEKVTCPPAASVTRVSIVPAPEPGQLEPTEAEQVQDTPVTAAGNGSCTRALVTVLGPALLTTMV